jgi:hypothetical protein
MPQRSDILRLYPGVARNPAALKGETAVLGNRAGKLESRAEETSDLTARSRHAGPKEGYHAPFGPNRRWAQCSSSIWRLSD